MTSEIFKDLKVVELASVLAGPSVGMFFSELGAEVIKFENALTKGDVTRSWKLPSEKKEDISAYFSSINFGKKHYLVDYNLRDDMDKVIGSIRDADIVICNFKEGLAKRFNLDYKHLSTINPKMVYAQLTGFESTKERVAFDVVLQAECGYMFMNGDKDSPPTKMPLAFMDVLAAHQMKEGILTALIKRYKTNKGSYVECSLEKSGLASLVNQASNYLMANHVPQRIGSLHPNIAPYGEIFRTADNKQIVLAIGSDKQFEKLCNLLIINSHQEEKFSTNKSRVKNRIELARILNLKISQLKSDFFLENCHKNQIPVGQIKNMKEVFENPTAKSMILEEKIENTQTKRISSIAFKIH